MENQTPQPWKLTWQLRHISAFWNWASQSEHMRSIYFSKSAADSIVRLTTKYISLKGTVLDYGCGPGDFTAKLVSKGIDTMGLDVSMDSVNALRKRLGHDAHFLGGHVLPLADPGALAAVADVAFVIEAVEHMDDAALHESFATIRKLLKPKGHLVVTTPNNEDLERAEIFCPNCGCLFHRMQHQRSWNKETLTAWMRKEGFDMIVCRPYHTRNRGFPLSLVQLAWRHLRYPVPPNLIYIGVRTG